MTFTSQLGQSVTVNRYIGYETADIMMTYYDLQSNGYQSNRMYQLPDGSVAAVATMSHEPNQTASDRGTGYNFCAGGDMDSWLDMPDTRVEGSTRTGWPTIAQWGETGEILISHSPLRCWTREVAGEGEWQYMGELPTAPAGAPYTDAPSWARVATSGDSHNIIHVIADQQHSVSSDEVVHYQFYWQSTDAVNWTVSYSPLVNDGEETGFYTADNYCIAANGHNVAMIYSDCLTAHVVMYKSTDDGQNWERTVIWENPYYGCDWETDECSIYTDTVFGPSNAAVCIDNNGVAHVALNTYEYLHDALGSTYTVWSGLTVDGIYYWNDTQTAPIQAEDGNPHHALRLWWPAEGGYLSHTEKDSILFCGWVAPEGESYWQNWTNDMFFHESDYFYKFRGTSALPAIAVDPEGNLACAYTTPFISNEDNDGTYYFRRVFASYKSVGAEKWSVAEDNLMESFDYTYNEGTAVIGVTNPVNVNEFWFGFQYDPSVGFYWGSNATQTAATENYISVVKISSTTIAGVEENEAADVVYSIYPNPATDRIVVKSSMNANATVTFINLAGQTVKSFNKALTTGDNSINIDLESGVYFCTINANGFNKTTKVVVK